MKETTIAIVTIYMRPPVRNIRICETPEALHAIKRELMQSLTVTIVDRPDEPTKADIIGQESTRIGVISLARITSHSFLMLGGHD